MPTFNRFPVHGHLVEEAVESFLRQDYPNKELILCNDTPGQFLRFEHPQVRVFNSGRFPTLSDKLQWMIDAAKGDILCRWDDDDISLPHRLSLSVERLGNSLEWRAENYWYDTGTLSESKHPANTHTLGIWRREVLVRIDGYPSSHCGTEDVAFNQALIAAGFPQQGDVLDHDEMFYLYRWATGSRHISGGGGDEEAFRERYRKLGELPIIKGEYAIKPRWKVNYVARALQAGRIAKIAAKGTEKKIGGYFDWPDLYKWLVNRVPQGGRIVEVGCLHGLSLTFLGAEAKKAAKRLSVVGVDYGRGLDTCPDYLQLPTLLANVRDAGLSDIVTVVAAESTAGAQLFPNHSLDAVFIDAGHDYQSVKADLQAWWPKVKPGGWIGGHDYGHPTFPDVKRAVDEFFGKPPGGCQSPRAAKCWEFVNEPHKPTAPIREKPRAAPAPAPAPKPTAPAIVSGDVRFSVVMPVYDDFEGVEKTVQALRLYHANRVAEIVVVDNHPSVRLDRTNPKGHSELTEHLCQKTKCRYIRADQEIGSAWAKNKAIDEATTKYVICTDSHNLFVPGALDRLGQYFERNPESPDLIHGPLLHDSLGDYWTHLGEGWGTDDVFGKWATDHAKYRAGEPFPIEAMGMGAFAIRKAAWVGFHRLLRGFGGEERFINLRTARAGNRSLCLPGFDWVHRWGRGSPVGYVGNDKRTRARNAIIAFVDLGLDMARCRTHFTTEETGNPLGVAVFEEIVASVRQELSGKRMVA